MHQPGLQAFLEEVQLRAFRMAQLAVHSEADALDLVQDAMMKLVEKYAERPNEEWAPLFYRILQNGITDHFRRSGRTQFLDELPAAANEEWQSNASDTGTPPALLEAEQLGQQLLDSIAQLPVRQQQCFMLRGWEGLSVEETASAMGLTSGSVKTHYFRAVAKLNEILEAQR